MNYAKIKKNSTANWVGISVSLYCQGCEFKCPHCFNKETWNPEGGKPFTDEVKKTMFEELKKSYYDALVLLGGEPTHRNNIETMTQIAKEFKDLFPNKTLVMFTGNVFEKIKNYEILNYLDYMIDGRFKQELYSPLLRFRGSSNQRIIDVQKSLIQNQVILATEFYEVN